MRRTWRDFPFKHRPHWQGVITLSDSRTGPEPFQCDPVGTFYYATARIKLTKGVTPLFLRTTYDSETRLPWSGCTP